MHEIGNELGDDEHSETLDVWIDGTQAGSLSVDRKRRTATVRVNLGPGFHTYELRGTSSMKDGRQMAITGRGTIATHAMLRTQVAAAPDLVSAARVFADLPGMTVEVQHATAEDLAAAEARLGLELPHSYRGEVLSGGAFVVRRDEQLLATLYHPSELLSPWDWMARYFGSPNRQELALFKRDVCYADIGGPMVFFYAENKRCPNGQPSFEHGFLDFDEMRESRSDPLDMYVSARPDHCDWSMMREYVHSAMVDKLTSESLAVAETGWNVYRTYEQPDREALQMYLLAY